MKRHGLTAIELIVAVVLCSVMLIGMFGLYTANSTVQTTTFDVTASARDARNSLDTLADHLRMAQMCDSSSGCTGVNSSVVSTGAANDLTYYSDSAGSLVRYYLSGSKLMRKVGSGAASIALYNVTSLSFSYYTGTGYESSALTLTAAPSAPTAAELPNLAAVRITASTTTGTKTIQYSTLVRLRNSPKRTTITK